VERKIRYVWWGILALLVLGAAWRLFLPHGNKAYVTAGTPAREIIVYVSGAVAKPGLVHLPLEARLHDALQVACPLAAADLDMLNPAAKLKDGQKITVPYKVMTISTSTATATDSGAAAPAPGTAATGANATSGGLGGNRSDIYLSGNTLTGGGTGKVNINTADAAEMDRLPGIGPVLAQRIIQYRDEHGPFSCPEDLQKVSGIGTKTYEKIASMVTVWP
jgi:competence protein ComEA